MERAKQEITAPIRRDTLRGLLDEMTAPEAATSTSESSQPKRKRPFSHVAALLPAEPRRFARATHPLVVPLRPATDRLTEKVARTVAEARARLDSTEEMAAERAASLERGSFPVISDPIVALLDGDEVTMLPMQLRLTQPRPIGWTPPPRIEMARAIVDPHAEPGEPALPVISVSVAMLALCFVAAFLVGVCAVFLLR